MGQKLKLGENQEGIYNKQEREKVIRYSENKGPEVTGYKWSGEKVIHNIPFSKEARDKAIGAQD